MPVIWNVPLLLVVMDNAGISPKEVRLRLSTITVLSVQELGVVQVQVPVGIATVSPAEAELIAFCTSLALQEAAVRVAACVVALKRTLRISPSNRPFMILVIDAAPSRKTRLTAGDGLSTRYRLPYPYMRLRQEGRLSSIFVPEFSTKVIDMLVTKVTSIAHRYHHG